MIDLFYDEGKSKSDSKFQLRREFHLAGAKTLVLLAQFKHN